jgi:selenocysteine-specific elongation factor
VDLEARGVSAGGARAGAAPTLAVDRVFTVRGRGTVVTGTLRGSGLAAGDTVRIEPGGHGARIREVQIHGAAVGGRAKPGRTALNLAGVDAGDLRRGQVVAAGPGIEVSDRLLVELRRPAALPLGPAAPWPPPHGARVQLHVRTDRVGARVLRAGRTASGPSDDIGAAILRLEAPIAASIGDRFVLRRTSPAGVVAGGVVLDPVPPTGAARRRVVPARLATLQAAVTAGDPSAVVAALADLHGVLRAARADTVMAALGPPRDDPAGPLPAGPLPAGPLPAGPAATMSREAAARLRLAPDVADELAAVALARVNGQPARDPLATGVPVAELRRELAVRLRRLTGLLEPAATAAAAGVLDGLVAEGRLARDGERVRDATRAVDPPAELLAAMERLERALSAPAPPPLSAAARAAGCPPNGVRALERAGRIVRVDLDLAWAAPVYHRLAATALAMARRAPLSPAAFRDATGTSRRYVLAILEDLDRRGLLQRGPDGHRLGPRAPAGSAPAPTGR